MYNLSRWRSARQVLVGLAAGLLLGGMTMRAVAQEAPDLLAPGAGPLVVWDRIPACLAGDPAASISRCETSLPKEAHVARALVRVWFMDFEGGS